MTSTIHLNIRVHDDTLRYRRRGEKVPWIFFCRRVDDFNDTLEYQGA
jgi:hypothetical protein